MVLLAAFKALLWRYTGQTDMVVGVPTAGRTRVELESLIGCLANALILRTDLAGDPSFRQLLARVRRWRSGRMPIRSSRSKSWWKSCSPSGASATIRSSR